MEGETMIKEDLNLSYKDFLTQYVVKPIMDYCISFKFRGNIYQFDFYFAPKNDDGTTKYYFVSHGLDWNKNEKRTLYKNLSEAIKEARIDELTFEEVYNSSESELIDIS